MKIKIKKVDIISKGRHVKGEGKISKYWALAFWYLVKGEDKTSKRNWKGVALGKLSKYGVLEAKRRAGIYSLEVYEGWELTTGFNNIQHIVLLKGTLAQEKRGHFRINVLEWIRCCGIQHKAHFVLFPVKKQIREKVPKSKSSKPFEQ